MGEYPKRSELTVGDFVEIAMYRQGNRKDKGEIESILTRAETHPHGIMAALTDKKIGRVQRKLPPPAKIPIDLDIAKELHKKIEKLTGAQQRRLLLDSKARERRLEAAKKSHTKRLEAWKKSEQEKEEDNLNKRAKKAAALWIHVPEKRHGKAEDGTESEELFDEVKKTLEKPSQDKQREVFLTKDIPEEEDDRNEFKESFKADTVYHKLLENGDKKAAEARKHSCESTEHAVKKEVSIAACAFANCEGGKLFIGIQDNPVEVIGLKSDLSAFKNFDEYIRGISDSIKSFTKNQYFTQNIKFRHGEERKFLVLHIPASSSVPVFIYDKDKEEFYVRGYAQSCLLQYTDAYRFIRDRFPDWLP